MSVLAHLISTNSNTLLFIVYLLRRGSTNILHCNNGTFQSGSNSLGQAILLIHRILMTALDCFDLNATKQYVGKSATVIAVYLVTVLLEQWLMVVRFFWCSDCHLFAVQNLSQTLGCCKQTRGGNIQLVHHNLSEFSLSSSDTCFWYWWNVPDLKTGEHIKMALAMDY